MAQVNREITFYFNTLTYLLNNLSAKQRGFTTTSADPNNESIWKSSKGWLTWKDVDGDLQLAAIQKYYDVTAGVWKRRSNVFADIEVDQVYTDTGLRDTNLASDLPISQSGVTALDVGFTATSIVGCLNELKNDIVSPNQFWVAAGDAVKPKNPYLYIHTKSGLKDDYASAITLGEAGATALDGSFTATSIVGALNELAVESSPENVTGWPYVRNVTISWDDGTRTLTLTDGGGAYYLLEGEQVLLGGNKSVQITDTEGMWFIYFDDLTGTLKASQTPWTIQPNDQVFVAIVYWDANSNKEILVGYELHDFIMAAATHERLHFAGGAKWSSGLALAETGTEEANVTAGVFYDEDIKINITDGAGGGLFEQVLSPAELPVYYRIGASNWRIVETSSKNRATDMAYIQAGNTLMYNKLNGSWTLQAVSTNKYMAMWVVGTNDLSEPVAMIMGQREDTTLQDAKDNNSWGDVNLTGMPFQELIILYRVIVNETASGQYYTIEDILDLRNFNTTGSASDPLIQSHSALADLDADDHLHYHNDTRGDVRYLYKENTTPFTPDADYEPATKKYVDDNTGAGTFIGLTDTPINYVGQAFKIPRVNLAEDGLEWIQNYTTFLILTDTPSSYSGQAGQIPFVNAAEDALIYDASTEFKWNAVTRVFTAGGMSMDTQSGYCDVTANTDNINIKANTEVRLTPGGSVNALLARSTYVNSTVIHQFLANAQVEGSGVPKFIIKDTGDTGVGQQGRLVWQGSDGLDDAYIGWQDASTDVMRWNNNKGIK